ncbi:MAG: ATP-binding protein, partial [Aquabacterium sp.]
GAIARALDMQLEGGNAIAQVARLIGGETRPLLLVLDNAEHLIEPCAEWAARLQTSARLLVTSQLALAVGGEEVLRIEPLAVADGDGVGSDDALALLIDRIGAADSRFRVMPETLPLLRALCRQLDGLPLALEMAAARIPLMGVRAVHDALAERFALLSRGRRDSPARHRTLQDALSWSYGLLAPPEQRLFRALGIFAGGFTLELAVSLNADEHIGRWDVVDGLATLVERSLVSVSGDDPPRYHLLESMRAYALSRLVPPGSRPRDDEGPSLRRRHAAVVIALFARGNDAIDECLAEMANAREAFHWACGHDLAAAAQISMGVARVIGFTVWRQEVTDWMLSLQPAMEQAPGQALPPVLQASWWSMLSYVLLVRRDPSSRLAATRAVALWRQLDKPSELQAALGNLVRALTEPGPDLDAACAELRRSAAAGVESPRAELRMHGALAEAARVRGDNAELLACREQELRLARELGWAQMAQAAETNICAALIDLGRHREAAERARALLQRLDETGDENNANLAWALYMLGEALLAFGALEEAHALVPRLLAAERRFGTSMAWTWVLRLAAAQGRLNTAALLLGHVQQVRARSQDSADLGERESLEEVSAAVRAALGDDAAAALAAEGAALGDEAAAALAVGEP